MPASLLAEWREFYRLEPFGFEWDWLRAGAIAAATYNANPFRKPGSEPVSPTVFVPDFAKPPRPAPTWQETKLAAMIAIRAMGGCVPDEAFKSAQNEASKSTKASK